jgi:hypothetical protein
MHSNNKQFVEIYEKFSDNEARLKVDKEADMRQNSP